MTLSISKLLRSILPSQPIYAHCDIPCGIYDPHRAQVAAFTIIRMIDLINDYKMHDMENPSFDERKEFVHQISRYTRVKDEHGEILKHEISVIWGDYFKEEQLKDYPDLNMLVFKIMHLASKARQTIDKSVAEELLAKVQEFAEIFYKSKGLTPKRIKAPYPTGGEIVSYQ